MHEVLVPKFLHKIVKNAPKTNAHLTIIRITHPILCHQNKMSFIKDAKRKDTYITYVRALCAGRAQLVACCTYVSGLMILGDTSDW